MAVRRGVTRQRANRSLRAWWRSSFNDHWPTVDEAREVLAEYRSDAATIADAVTHEQRTPYFGLHEFDAPLLPLRERDPSQPKRRYARRGPLLTLTPYEVERDRYLFTRLILAIDETKR